MIELVAFLGNPGKKFSHYRHNAGYMLADKASSIYSLSWQKKFKGFYTILERSRLEEELSDTLPRQIHFIKPLTFMNLSGESVIKVASFNKIKTNRILVVHDELELPLGTISLKSGGGLGGHNGLRSMNACFGNADFWRIRIGIGRPDQRLPGEGGRPGSGEGIADWVLSDFSKEETESMECILDTANELLLASLKNDPQTLLPKWAKMKVELNDLT